ncbi:MAG: (d)CMP kinase [Deltaproteobacteria bacterium]|nr:(d)CMP kinase [Deltaproteobacteria bacterium]
MNAGLIIAIDGPSGAGKSSSSRLLAKRLDYRYVDTGALYRVLGLLAVEKGVSADDPERLAALCDDLPLRFLPEAGGVRIVLGERDITAAIRRPEVSQMASKVSAQSVVRRRLLGVQRELGTGGGVVMEGRDIGTAVFPEADVKFYLDASPEVRGRRRYAELQDQGVSAGLQKTIQEMAERDHRDSTREHAPLQRAADAIVLDTTSLSLPEVVETMARAVQAACKC